MSNKNNSNINLFFKVIGKNLFERIAAKIFGLSVFLLSLTLILSAFLFREVNNTNAEISIIANFDLPLAAAVNDINETGLRRRLAFARLFGALNSDRPNQEIVSEASSNFEIFMAKQQSAFRHAENLLDRYPVSQHRSEHLVEIRFLLKQIEESFSPVIARQRQLIEMQKNGMHDEANRMVNVLNDQINAIQNLRSEAAAKAERLTASAAESIQERYARVKTLTIATTVSFITFGLLIAAWVTRRLTQPIQSLTQAVSGARTGNLSISLQNNSNDEIGILTESFNFFIQELRAKEEIKKTFGKYIDPRVLERMLLAPGAKTEAGEKQIMTVSFGDIVGFTQISERLSPTLMVILLNRHFGLQAQAVQRHLGIVDKYIGDAIMSFWGPPFVESQEQSLLACRAALQQVESLSVLHAELPTLMGLRKNDIELDVCIGIATGEVIVGNIGSESSRSYTVIGDTVNIAARLEGVNRIYGTRILISHDTAISVRNSMNLRELDTIVVKGRSEPLVIFELIGEKEKTPQHRIEAAQNYEKGLLHYRTQNWKAATEYFGAVLALNPDDKASCIMRERCATFIKQPPAANWDGVWRLTEK